MKSNWGLVSLGIGMNVFSVAVCVFGLGASETLE